MFCVPIGRNTVIVKGDTDFGFRVAIFLESLPEETFHCHVRPKCLGMRGQTYRMGALLPQL